MSPVVLVMVAVGLKEASEFLVKSFYLSVGLWVVPGGETDVDVEGLEE